MRFSLLKYLTIPLFIACADNTAPENKKSDTGAIVPQKQDNTVGNEKLLEEAVPDTGLMNNVNPEEIITDDWSDEGEIELDTEQ